MKQNGVIRDDEGVEISKKVGVGVGFGVGIFQISLVGVGVADLS